MGAPAQILLTLARSRRLWAQLFWYCRGLGGFGAAFLVLPRSRRLWAQFFWYCRGLGGFGRSFFGTAAVSQLWAQFFWYCRGFIGLQLPLVLARKILPQNTAAFAEVLRAGRPLPRRRGFEQAETSVHEKTGGTTACPLFLTDCTGNSVPPARQSRAAKAAAGSMFSPPVCFFLPHRKSGGRLNVQHSLRRSPLGR